MTIVSGKELLEKKVKPSDQVLQQEINAVSSHRSVSEQQKKRCECRRKIEHLKEEQRLRKMTEYDF